MIQSLLRVLVVEDSKEDTELILREIQRGGYTVEFERVETKSAMEEALANRSWDVILSDYSMPRFSAMAALATLMSTGLDIPFLVISGVIGEETAVSALKAGAHDFLVKGKLARLVPAIERELRDAEIRRSHREVELRYKLLVEHLPIIAYVSPANEVNNTTYVNPQIQGIMGFTPEEWLADPRFWQTRLHPEDRTAVIQNVEQSGLTGKPFDMEYRMLARDGHIVWFHDQAILVHNERGQPLYWQGLKIDITKHQQAEDRIRQLNADLERRVAERTTELERALRAKDEFLANMSHELRTPLNAILGLSESLAEQTAGPLNEKQKKYITTINESGQHLLSLINDILDLAKIESAQIVLNINEVDLKRVCQASLRMIDELAYKKGQHVTLELDESIRSIWVDERRLKQILVNILSNAVKFTPENGALGLEVRGDQQEKRVMFTVWDHGIGISESDLKRLFQPFVQLDSGLAREATGTGLGLTLVAQMARLHGGSVTVESQAGKGSRFTVILPWEPALATDAALRLRSTGKFRAVKPGAQDRPVILLIEDTRETTVMISDFLEANGYNVLAAREGVTGIDQARVIHPDLILIDIQIPNMDGLEVTRRLRADPNFRTVPIIALTALAMPGDRERCLAAGANDYMSKPVSLKKLAQMIDMYVLR
ncbi:MAG TPA: response regulator [Anaerolineales bacterium]|nr:response regulator [Anaerolineales bacterium]